MPSYESVNSGTDLLLETTCFSTRREISVIFGLFQPYSMFSSFYYGITGRIKMLQELMIRVLVPFYGNKIPLNGQKGHNKGSVFDRLFNMSD